MSGTDFIAECTTTDQIIDWIFYHIIGPILNYDLTKYGCGY
jgi:hypothetical protein